MKFLKEAFGESTQLDDFVYLADKDYNEYYQVETKNNRGEYSYKYFSTESAAREYYISIKTEMDNDPEFYDGYDLTLHEVKVNREYNELDSYYIIYDEEE